uniref:Protein G12 n=1 Tax=Anopheles culicifacies TaxID=139723 RepID=A0A182M931_9DIPT
MKFLPIVLGFLCAGFANAATLREEFDQLLPYLNMEQVRAIYNRYIETDAQVAEIYAFLQTDEVDLAWNVLINQPELRTITDWTEERGVSIRDYLNRIAAVLGLTPIVPSRAVGARSWSAMMDEIRAVSDIDGAFQLAQQFIATPGSEFAQLHQLVGELHDVFHEVAEHPDVLRVSNQLRAYGVDVDRILEVIYMFFGWHDH